MELLAVVAVIGVLAGLLLPVLSRTREKARQAICLNNLHQLGLAAQLYWSDHEGRTFRYRGAAINNGDLYWFGWLERGSEGDRQFDPSAGVLAPYLGGRGVELCPSLNYDLAEFKQKALGASYGYGYNIRLSADPGVPAFNMDGIRLPSRVTVLADAGQVNTFQAPASPDHPMLEEFYYISPDEPTTHFRHAAKADAVFADGHGEALTPAAGSLDLRLPRQVIGRLDSIYLMP